MHPPAQLRDRREAITRGDVAPLEAFLPAVELRILVDHKCAAQGVATATISIAPGADLPPCTYDCGQALTVLEGRAVVAIEGGFVALDALDSLFAPAGAVHAVRNQGPQRLLLHAAYSSSQPKRTGVDRLDAPDVARHGALVRRVADRQGYELGAGTEFHDLFARRFGASGICGGWARFQAGSSLPCHYHEYDESITIVEGRAVCLVEGRRYELSGCDTAFVPQGLRHRFLNLSDQPMSMVWVYAGDEPNRTVVDADCCSKGRPA